MTTFPSMQCFDFSRLTIVITDPDLGPFGPRLTRLTPSRENGVDCYTLRTSDMETADRLPLHSRRGLTVLSGGRFKDVPCRNLWEKRMFEVISVLPGGEVSGLTYLDVTLRAVPEGE